jgi:hypothetical protein
MDTRRHISGGYLRVEGGPLDDLSRTSLLSVVSAPNVPKEAYRV